jgi:hypothetical protein
VCVFNVDIVEESKRIHPLQEIEIKKARCHRKLLAESIEWFIESQAFSRSNDLAP